MTTLRKSCRATDPPGKHPVIHHPKQGPRRANFLFSFGAPLSLGSTCRVPPFADFSAAEGTPYISFLPFRSCTMTYRLGLGKIHILDQAW
jgi:hypothetical protein